MVYIPLKFCINHKINYSNFKTNIIHNNTFSLNTNVTIIIHGSILNILPYMVITFIVYKDYIITQLHIFFY